MGAPQMEQPSHSVNECCKEEDNLEIRDSGKSDLILRVCKVCNRRHFELTINRGIFGIQIKALQ